MFKIVGHRINPSRKIIRKAISLSSPRKSIEILLKETKIQKKQGCDIIDVNLPEKILEKYLEKINDVDIWIDSKSGEEFYLSRFDCVKAINSVNYQNLSKLNDCLEFIKNRNKKVVISPVSGITGTGSPPTLEDRIRTSESLIDKVVEMGIDTSQIIVDPCVFPIIMELPAVSLSILEYFKKKGFQTVVGISNTSFGIPQNLKSKVNSMYLYIVLSIYSVYKNQDYIMCNYSDREIRSVVKFFKNFGNRK